MASLFLYFPNFNIVPWVFLCDIFLQTQAPSHFELLWLHHRHAMIPSATNWLLCFDFSLSFTHQVNTLFPFRVYMCLQWCSEVFSFECRRLRANRRYCQHLSCVVFLRLLKTSGEWGTIDCFVGGGAHFDGIKCHVFFSLYLWFDLENYKNQGCFLKHIEAKHLPAKLNVAASIDND